jgi:uncharacterized membrane protein (Fun14 family)
MITKIIVFIVGILFISLLFLINNAINKPVYNKMSNVWEDDPQGRKFSNFIIILIAIISFVIGLIF